MERVTYSSLPSEAHCIARQISEADNIMELPMKTLPANSLKNSPVALMMTNTNSS
jgi:hypothetical protein